MSRLATIGLIGCATAIAGTIMYVCGAIYGSPLYWVPAAIFAASSAWWAVQTIECQREGL